MAPDAATRSELPVYREETDAGTRIVADLGPAVTEAAIDVVDGTAIVVIEDAQYEFELPAGTVSDTFITNGVLSIEVTEQ
jgi:hypothetical protein